jgi:CIC family chloride channel protein
VIILFELTGDYRIILPLMVTVVLSTLVSEALSRDTIYTLKLRRRGIDLHIGREVDPMRTIPVAAAMSTEVSRAPEDLTVAEATERLEEQNGWALVIIDEHDTLIGIVTASDLERAMFDNRIGATVAEIASRSVVTAVVDEDLSQAVHRMNAHDVRQLPVVAREDPTHVIGMLNRADVVRAYSRTVLRQLERQRRRPVLPEELRGTQLVEVPIDDQSPLAGRRVRELRLPSDTLIITVERDGQTTVPGGATQLSTGDRAIFLVQSSRLTDLHAHLAALTPQAKAPVPDGAASADADRVQQPTRKE